MAQKQVEEGVTRDRLQRLIQDIPTRWHSRLAAMSIYLCRLQNNSAVAQEVKIDSDDLSTLSEDHRTSLQSSSWYLPKSAEFLASWEQTAR